MRTLISILLCLLLLAPAATATLPGGGGAPVAHATVDVTAHRDVVDGFVDYALPYHKANGGIYEYESIGKDLDNMYALAFLARVGSLDVRGDAFTDLLEYYRSTQNVDGSWGSQTYTVPMMTAIAVASLVEAGFDAEASMIERAVLNIKLRQNLNGGWSDGTDLSPDVTARNVEALLAVDTARDHRRVQDAVTFILQRQGAGEEDHPGSWRAIPGVSPTPTATAIVIGGLDAYLRAPATGSERIQDADVEAAIALAFEYLEESLPEHGKWQGLVGANAHILGPVITFHVERGLPLPAWVELARDELLDHVGPNGGLKGHRAGGELLDLTLIAGTSLLAEARDLNATDEVTVQTTVNVKGTYEDAVVTLTLVDASGAVVASDTAPTGFTTLAWTGLPEGTFTLRAESPGAHAWETTVHR
jgi:hypothetical protein